MLAIMHLAWAWLAAINATLPYSALTCVAYSLIYAWRKLSPRSWLWLETRLPWAAELDAGEVIAKNIALGLPSVVIGAALAALSSGGAVVPVVLGAVAGAFAPLLHHVRKALPFDPYRGAVADVTPKVPLLPLLCLLLGLGVGTTTGGCSSAPVRVPCDASDHVAQLDLATHAAECRERVLACKGVAACRDPIIAECDAWGDARCAEGSK